MSNDYVLEFDFSIYEKLDHFALIADQSYNFGNINGWFDYFRGGFHGFLTRILGVRIHYREVHSWEIITREENPIGLAEYHLSSIFFNMDSSIECLVFGLNALGYAVNSSEFLDITSDKKLREIGPKNILGERRDSSKGIILGYDKYFPSLKNHFEENRDLIFTIQNHHNVSKHRSIIFQGGRQRTDPPQYLIDLLGIKNDMNKIILKAPWAEINLRRQPKTLPEQHLQGNKEVDIDNLEDIAERFCKFINKCGDKTFEDVRNTIKLNKYES